VNERTTASVRADATAAIRARADSLGAEHNAIVIPTAMKPADGRFGSGPSKVPAETIAELARSAPMGTSHRQPPVKDLVARIRRGVTELLGLPDGYEVLLGNGGSTLFWDAAVLNLFQRRVQHVVCGEFSSKFAAVSAAAPFLDKPHVRRADPGSGVLPGAVDGVDAYCWPQNETSTGVVLPVAAVTDADPDALTVVDGTSAAGAVLTDLSVVDVYYFAPQKVFAGDGGLWLAVLSPKALQRLERVAASDRWIPPSLDLTIAADNSRSDQTYNTPAIASLWLLAHSTEALLARGGVEWAARRTQLSSGRLYRWAEREPYARPFVAEPDLRSPVVGTIDFVEDVDAAAVAAVLRTNGIVDVEPYRGLGRNQLRIGMYPAVDPADIEALTHCIEFVVRSL
jgi:phosphoserine aminotransferase